MDRLTDFERHVSLHIQRTRKLAEAARELPEYSDLPVELVRDFLDLHDQSKINRSQAFLAQHRLEGRRESLLQSLHRLRGTSNSEVSAVAQKLNDVDNEVAHAFFQKEKLLTPEGRLSWKALMLLEIEKIADLVDRGLEPVTAQEFGRSMRPASEWFELSAFRAADPLAQALEVSPESAARRLQSLTTLDSVARVKAERELARQSGLAISEIRKARFEVGQFRRMALAAGRLESRYAQIVHGLEFRPVSRTDRCGLAAAQALVAPR